MSPAALSRLERDLAAVADFRARLEAGAAREARLGRPCHAETLRRLARAAGAAAAELELLRLSPRRLAELEAPSPAEALAALPLHPLAAELARS